MILFSLPGRFFRLPKRGQYSPYWRNIRKLCTLNLLSNLKISSFELFVESFKQAAVNLEAVDVSAQLAALNADMICLMAFGRKYDYRDFDERGFESVIKDFAQLLATPYLADYYPFIGRLNLQGLTRKMKGVAKVYDEFFEKVIDEHEQSADQVRRADDFVHTLLALMKSGETDFQFDCRHIKAILLDVLSAGIDTSELIKHPRVMKKLQQELEEVVGQDRMVEESDLSSLKYLDMVVKEGLRLHPVAPLLIPHAAREDCTVNGFHIPKSSTVIINVWAIGRDPSAWGTDAEEFILERFEGSDVDVRGRDFRLLPFGSGRRICPGMQLALTVVRLLLAQMVHCFNWELPNGMLPEELDMNEEFGLVVTRAEYLLAIPSFRLSK